MPNLHWFGTEADHRGVLSDILALDEVQVFELYSRPDKPIRTFSNVTDILAEFDVPHQGGSRRTTLELNLWVNGSGPAPQIERTTLDPQKSGGHRWRERSGAVGFVSFYLARQADDQLMYSQTNTVSEARMGATDGIYTGYDGSVWNIRHTVRFSRKLNNMIKRKSVARIRTASVLPHAAALWDDDVTFGYHWSKTKTPELFVQS